MKRGFIRESDELAGLGWGWALFFGILYFDLIRSWRTRFCLIPVSHWCRCSRLGLFGFVWVDEGEGESFGFAGFVAACSIV